MAVKYHCRKCGKRFVDWGAEKLEYKCPDCDDEELVRIGSAEDKPVKRPSLKRKVPRPPKPAPAEEEDFGIEENEPAEDEDIYEDEEEELEEEEEEAEVAAESEEEETEEEAKEEEESEEDSEEFKDIDSSGSEDVDAVSTDSEEEW